MENITKERIALQELHKAREAVKRKYDMIRSQKENTEDFIGDTFKPIIEPIKELVETKKRKKIDHQKSSADMLDRSFTLDKNSVDDNKSNESEEYLDADNTSINLNNTFEDEKVTIPAIEQDRLYGIREHGEGYMLGNAPIRFGKEHIIVNNIKFPRTQGLYDLIVLKKPKNYELSDLSNYKQILEETNVHRSNFKPNAPLKKHATSHKYNNIIARTMSLSPANAKHKTPFKKFKKSALSRKNEMSPMIFSTPKHGFGLIPPYKIAKRNTRMDYIYWNDPNELVERLRLLIAEQSAGNHNHTNEIHAIIQELREDKYIY